MNRYLLPLKREIWEHHGVFIKTPIIVLAVLSAILLVASVVGNNILSDAQVKISHYSNDYSFPIDGERNFSHQDEVIGQIDEDLVPDDSVQLPATPYAYRGQLEGVGHGIRLLASLPYIIFDHLGLLILFMYLLTALYGDRKNNSVLFWKSMPVSEWQNVLTKLVVGTLLIPAISWLTALVFSVILLVFALVSASFSDQAGMVRLVLQHQHILGAAWSYIGSGLAVSFWLLPIICWVLLVSAFSKKAPLLFAILPLIAMSVFEYFVFGSHNFSSVLNSYLSLTNVQMNQNMLIYSGWNNLFDVFSSLQFWFGLVISGIMLYVTVWLRERRFEI